MQLYDYQEELKLFINMSWQRHRNVIGVLPTGGGKTVVFASILHDHKGAAVAIAHRKELVNQISLALAREGVMHGVIGAKGIVPEIAQEHTNEIGTTMLDPNSQIQVASVHTLINKQKEMASWMNQVTLWVTDECHHLLRENTWGRASAMFPNAKGLGVTATPIRADRKGLGAHASGVFEDIVVGPSMRELIERGFLTDYRIFAPPSDMDVANVPTARDGDFNRIRLAEAAHESNIVGDIVTHYLKIAPGKLGITFVTDVQTATEVAQKYNAFGVPAEVVSSKTPAKLRTEILRRFKRRELLQLVNVDLFGEGFDLPAVEVCSFGRPTQSYGLYVQQFGRALRVLEGKQWAIIIDHAGNVMRHGLPDKERVWSLEGGERVPRHANEDDNVPIRYCVQCTQPYERVLTHCPHCGTKWVPEDRSGPEYVDGDLYELSPDVLEAMRKDVAAVNADPLSVGDRLRYAGAGDPAIHGAIAQHARRLEVQTELREAMAWWSARHHVLGRSDQEIQRRFYHTFGVDILSAQALGRPAAEELKLKILEKMQ